MNTPTARIQTISRAHDAGFVACSTGASARVVESMRRKAARLSRQLAQGQQSAATALGEVMAWLSGYAQAAEGQVASA